MAKILEFIKKLDKKKGKDIVDARLDMGAAALDSLDPEDREAALDFAAYIIAGHVAVGLGLVKWHELSAGSAEDLRYYDLIDGLYQKHLSQCWFCNPDTDPEKEPFNLGKTSVCVNCRKKLRAFGFAISNGKVDLKEKLGL